MLKDALRQIRFYPGRIVATVVAIAIGIAFMVAVSVTMRTEQDAMGKQLAAYATNSDLSVSIERPTEDATSAKIIKTIESTDGVAKAEVITSTVGMIEFGDHADLLDVTALPSEDFRWSKLDSGRWPEGPTEIALPKRMADDYGLSLGDKVEVTLHETEEFTVVGLTKDPKSVLTQQRAYLSSGSLSEEYYPGFNYVIKLETGASAERVAAALDPKIRDYVWTSSSSTTEGYVIGTPDEIRDYVVEDIMPGTNVLKYAVLAFGVLALLVATIIIGSTFQILIAQRRRQIGLLRAVGASGSQVRGQFLFEAVLIGSIGSLAGIAAGILIAFLASLYTGSIGFGLSIPPGELVIEFFLGVVITLIAALAPSLQTTRIAPLEALRPIDTVEQRRKRRIGRTIVCSIFAVLGVLALLLSRSTTPENLPLVWGLVAMVFFTIAVMGAAPLYVPVFLRAFAALVGKFGPTAKLAALNSIRNPRRSSATATALMLAVGLIVSLQVGTATIRKTAIDEINENFPIDVAISEFSWNTQTEKNVLTDELFAQVEAAPNVAKVVKLQGTTANSVKMNGSEQYGLSGDLVLGWTDELLELNDQLSRVDDNTVLVAPVVKDYYEIAEGQTITIEGSDGAITVAVQFSNAMDFQTLMVSGSNLKKLSSNPQNAAFWLRLADRDNLVETFKALDQILPMNSISVSGSAAMAFVVEQVLNVMLIVMTALLGVAVLVALVGVANTLGLSVIERNQESAMLRALGMQKSKLRLMLLIEALLLAGVGLLIGFIAGSFFAWLLITSGINQMDVTDVSIKFAIDPWWTIGLLLVVVGAAALASVGPGHKAASVTPTEALARE